MLHTKMFYHYLFDLITIVWYCYWNLWTMIPSWKNLKLSPLIRCRPKNSILSPFPQNGLATKRAAWLRNMENQGRSKKKQSEFDYAHCRFKMIQGDLMIFSMRFL